MESQSVTDEATSEVAITASLVCLLLRERKRCYERVAATDDPQRNVIAPIEGVTMQSKRKRRTIVIGTVGLDLPKEPGQLAAPMHGSSSSAEPTMPHTQGGSINYKAGMVKP